MFIEAVTVCKGYDDFLSEVAPYNRPLLDRWIVVTDPSDEKTRSVCRKFSIECVTSEEHKREGPFNKGRMIDRGLSHLQADQWLLHIDADIALPSDFRCVLNDAHLDESCVYGCDRLNVKGEESWDRIRKNGLLSRQSPWMVAMERPETTIGARVANNGLGWTPLGFMTLWHSAEYNYRGFPTKKYPVAHGSAARTDVMHTLHWDRRKRVLIPELLVWHLESEPAKMGANWKGRTTKPFRAISPTEETKDKY